MAFDPSSVDLSFVEPALRPEVLRRILVLEEFRRSRGPAARRKACEELDVAEHQLHTLLRAWTSRGRAEDVTLRATKRHRPAGIDPEVRRLIDLVADEDPAAMISVMAERIAAAATAAGLPAPTYPTICKFVRERTRTRGVAAIAGDADLLVDVIVTELPVLAPDGSRVRPHLLLLADARGAIPAIRVVTGEVTAQEVAALVSDALIPLPAANGTLAPRLRAGIMRLSLAEQIDLPAAAIRRLASEEVTVGRRNGPAARRGAIATAILGTAVAGYKLRPRLVGRSVDKRAAVHHGVAGSPAEDAASFLAAMIGEHVARSSPVIDGLPRERRCAIIRALSPRTRRMARGEHDAITAP